MSLVKSGVGGSTVPHGFQSLFPVSGREACRVGMRGYRTCNRVRKRLYINSNRRFGIGDPAMRGGNDNIRRLRDCTYPSFRWSITASFYLRLLIYFTYSGLHWNCTWVFATCIFLRRINGCPLSYFLLVLSWWSVIVLNVEKPCVFSGDYCNPRGFYQWLLRGNYLSRQGRISLIRAWQRFPHHASQPN